MKVEHMTRRGMPAVARASVVLVLAGASALDADRAVAAAICTDTSTGGGGNSPTSRCFCADPTTRKVAHPGGGNNGGTNGVVIQVFDHQALNFGTFTRPSTPLGLADSSITITPEGARQNGARLNISATGTSIGGDPSKHPRQGLIRITGGANCLFEVTITIAGDDTGGLSAVSLGTSTSVSGTTYTLGTGRRGRIPSNGSFYVSYGATKPVQALPSAQAAGGRVTINARYVDPLPGDTQ